MLQNFLTIGRSRSPAAEGMGRLMLQLLSALQVLDLPKHHNSSKAGRRGAMQLQ